jgi:sterol desaturase/sphingolipid hydroxylase (fatty acid hydroxylase superfamily)
MMTDKEKIIARLLFVPITGVFAFLLFTQFGKSLNGLIYNLTEDNYLIFLRYDTRDTVIFGVTVSWIITHIIFEIVAYLYKDFKCKRFLALLRYSPIAILIISVLAVQAYDAGMINYSKQQIRNYIYDDAQLIIEPDIRLHNNYRHWSGNGASATENYLYFETVSE